jgi:protein-tyrosine kinase
MSRNFELLQKLGREQELLGPTAPVNENSDDTATTPLSPATAMDGAAAASVEQIVALVQNVFLARGAEAPRAVVFSATERDAGCTWVCAQAAEVLSTRVAGSVCLVDANFYAPALHRQLGADNSSGLAEALTQLDPVRTFVRARSRNLWMVTSGGVNPASASLLSSDRMRLRMTELRKEFDYVLIDTPAMAVSHDAIGIGALSDGVVLVLKANTSRRQSARQAVDDLQAGKAKVLGAVLNQRTFPIPQSIYKRL